MPKAPIRRGQLIAPFGVGAMVIGKDGTSMICGGLDYWYRREGTKDPDDAELAEFKVEEWRLQERLRLDHFRLPPDYRIARPGSKVPNPFLAIPFLRFPAWHVCPRCGMLRHIPPSHKGAVECPDCKARGQFRRMTQVPFIAVCDQGHISDFPWRQWVHRDLNPTCHGTLYLRNTGGATLSAQQVKCSCGEKRALASITGAEGGSAGRTALSMTLAKDGEYTCQGHRPWFGPEVAETARHCGRHVRGSLRNALNVYFADVQSAIYLPRNSDRVPPALLEQLSNPPLSNIVTLAASGAQIESVVSTLISIQPSLGSEYGRETITEALAELKQKAQRSSSPLDEEEGSDDDDIQFRYAEYRGLRTTRTDPDLIVRQLPRDQYPLASRYFAQVGLVEKLRETRVLNGFSRIRPEAVASRKERRNLMWQHADVPRNNWLPAQVVHGEGIYLELDPKRLAEWEQRPAVLEHVGKLAHRHGLLVDQGRIKAKEVSPRFILLHTLAHLLMNQLTFSCGYSSATLRERLYASQQPGTNMAGVLIYTADGDADGTLGGLVRMGRPELFELVLRQAVLNAEWCSADPICMEAGESGGQGPDSLNLAACHSCALVPETACEEFNRLLDRATVVGTLADPSIGYFSELLLSR